MEDIKNNVKIIESVYKKLSNVDQLNSGGCGVAAYSVYKYLSIHHPDIAKEVKLVFVYIKGDDNDGLKLNRKSINNKKFDYVPHHVVLKYNLYYFDSNFVNRKYQFINYNRVLQVIGDFDFTHALLHLINHYPWNKSFDRKRYIPVIERMLGVKLNEIKRNRVFNEYY